MSVGLWIGVGLMLFGLLMVFAAAVGRLLRGPALVESNPRLPRPYIDEDLLERLRIVENERFELEGRLERARQYVEVETRDRRAVAQALVDLDTAAGKLLNASLHSREIVSIADELLALDETRGRVWASYNAASDALKAADPNHPFKAAT